MLTHYQLPHQANRLHNAGNDAHYTNILLLFFLQQPSSNLRTLPESLANNPNNPCNPNKPGNNLVSNTSDQVSRDCTDLNNPNHPRGTGISSNNSPNNPNSPNSPIVSVTGSVSVNDAERIYRHEHDHHEHDTKHDQDDVHVRVSRSQREHHQTHQRLRQTRDDVQNQSASAQAQDLGDLGDLLDVDLSGQHNRMSLVNISHEQNDGPGSDRSRNGSFLDEAKSIYSHAHHVYHEHDKERSQFNSTAHGQPGQHEHLNNLKLYPYPSWKLPLSLNSGGSSQADTNNL